MIVVSNISGSIPGHPELGSADPAQAAFYNVQLGDVLTYDAVFDPAALIDISAAANALYGGIGSGIRAAALSAPGSFFKFDFDGSHYNQDVSEGVDASGLGVAYPYVIYHNNEFWGFDILALRRDGFLLGLVGEEELSLGRPANAFGGNFFSGLDPAFIQSFDAGVATISAVPESSTWALAMLGFGLAGAMMRSRRDAANRTGGAAIIGRYTQRHNRL